VRLFPRRSIRFVSAQCLARDVQVAGGGVAIILSGLVGVFIVGKLANLEELEKEWGMAGDSPSEVVTLNDAYDDGDNVEAVKKE
jgi:hypothetical protein